MAATNAVKKPVATVTKKPVASSTRTSTISSSASQSAAVQQAAQSNQQTQQAGQQGTGIFNWQLPNIMPSLDQFLGLPAVIDWQDIGIRVSMVFVGIVIVLLVAWSFVRGKQTTVVNVQSAPQQKEVAA